MRDREREGEEEKERAGEREGGRKIGLLGIHRTAQVCEEESRQEGEAGCRSLQLNSAN